MSARRRLARREKWMIGAVLGAVVALVIVVAVSFGAGGRTSGHGCIYASVPGPVGAQEVRACGADARSVCRSVFAPGSFAPQAARVVAAACRKAGLQT